MIREDLSTAIPTTNPNGWLGAPAVKTATKLGSKIKGKLKTKQMPTDPQIIMAGHELKDEEMIKESYKPSASLKSRTKFLVQPNLSQKLKDRLAKRGKSKSSYKPSEETLRRAAAAKREMTKENIDMMGTTFRNENPYHLGDSVSHQGVHGKVTSITGSYVRFKHSKGSTEKHFSKLNKMKEEIITSLDDILPILEGHPFDKKRVVFSGMKSPAPKGTWANYLKTDSGKKLKQRVKEINKRKDVKEEHKHILELSNNVLKKYVKKSIKKAEAFGTLSDKHRTGVERATRKIASEHIEKVGSQFRLVSKKSGKNLGTYGSRAGALKREREVEYFKNEDFIFEAGKKIKSSKTEMKRKYLGKTRGTTATGKPAHAIDTQPMLGSGKVKDKA